MREVINYKYATKRNKHILINFIRSHYSNVSLRDIIKGTYQVVCENGFLIGVLFELAKDELYRMKEGLKVSYAIMKGNDLHIL